ncbi:uncharacterized protein LOC108238754 isoform X2 [Kryptolebias marmoratus]|uniref:uncharacterized protein LOC108238754 isoform X2 n=1 Tax=Kryptolebias marmoratus TaxID=37003 RepID=UPI0007F88020|nr:uncharacterized protein LOC108238754 isoform X2 [Kryptolebias marmoratus]
MGGCDKLRAIDLTCFPRCNGIRGEPYLAQVSKKVLELRGEKRLLNNPNGATLTICPLEDTEYKDNPGEVNGCSKFYLPMPRKMEVIGYVEGTLYPCDQLILMICGDGKLYSYDGDELHEVASSLQHLREVGIDYPASKSFYYGEAFKDMTPEDWDEVRRTSSVVKKLEEEHREMVASHKSKMSEIIRKSKQKRRLRQQLAAPTLVQ